MLRTFYTHTLSPLNRERVRPECMVYVCMYVCVYVRTYICTHTDSSNNHGLSQLFRTRALERSDQGLLLLTLITSKEKNSREKNAPKQTIKKSAISCNFFLLTLFNRKHYELCSLYLRKLVT